MVQVSRYLLDNNLINNDICLFIIGALALGLAFWWILFKK
jgi:hypothetical protein